MVASLDLATAVESPITSVPAALETMLAQATGSAAPTSTPEPTSGTVQTIGDDAHSAPPSAPATVMIVVGVVLGIVGVASVITLIWWMRRRAMMRYQISTAFPPQQNFYYPPSPPPKERSMMNAGSSPTSKALPPINVAAATAAGQNRGGRSNTAGSIDKDKALPIKPLESVWSMERPSKSPALASVHELRDKASPRVRHDEEAAIGSVPPRGRSDSIGSYKEPTAPANFL